jgi:2-polyprenyl-3-methyl-5-hydroxy-6-metoxy-1,4-benzoquinol methylase
MIHQFGIEQGSRFTWAVRTLERLKLANPAIQTVFDIGSGNELLRHQIETMGLVYRSFDMSPQNTNVQQWNIEERFPYPGTADVLVCLEIIEHLNNPWLGMRNVSATLATGGHLIMTS